MTTTSRRAVLAGIATVPVVDIWRPARDPIYAAIEAHRAVAETEEARRAEHHVRYEAMIGAPCDARDAGKISSDECERQCNEAIRAPDFCETSDRWNEAAEAATRSAAALALTQPTTLPGITAAVAYLAEHLDAIDHDLEDDAIILDLEGAPTFHCTFLQTIAEALAEIGGRT